MGKEKTTRDNQTAPLERAYWVVPGKLLAGCYPGDRDNDTARTKLDRLMTAGIRHFIDLTTPDEVGHNNKPLEPYVYLAANIAMKRGIEATFDRFGIKDTWVPTRKEMGLIHWTASITVWKKTGQSTCTAGAVAAGPAPWSGAI